MPLKFTEKEKTLEEALQRMSQIVEALEKNEINLEDSLKLYEEGISLAKDCQKKLSDAEKKIEILSQISTDKVEMEPFQP